MAKHKIAYPLKWKQNIKNNHFKQFIIILNYQLLIISFKLLPTLFQYNNECWNVPKCVFLCAPAGPGPGRYALPPTIGYINHDYTKPSSPAYSFHSRMSSNSEWHDNKTLTHDTIHSTNAACHQSCLFMHNTHIYQHSIYRDWSFYR